MLFPATTIQQLFNHTQPFECYLSTAFYCFLQLLFDHYQANRSSAIFQPYACFSINSTTGHDSSMFGASVLLLWFRFCVCVFCECSLDCWMVYLCVRFVFFLECCVVVCVGCDCVLNCIISCCVRCLLGLWMCGWMWCCMRMWNVCSCLYISYSLSRQMWRCIRGCGICIFVSASFALFSDVESVVFVCGVCVRVSASVFRGSWFMASSFHGFVFWSLWLQHCGIFGVFRGGWMFRECLRDYLDSKLGPCHSVFVFVHCDYFVYVFLVHAFHSIDFGEPASACLSVSACLSIILLLLLPASFLDLRERDRERAWRLLQAKNSRLLMRKNWMKLHDVGDGWNILMWGTDEMKDGWQLDSQCNGISMMSTETLWGARWMTTGHTMQLTMHNSQCNGISMMNEYWDTMGGTMDDNWTYNARGLYDEYENVEDSK